MKLTKKMLKQILKNQKDIMIKLHTGNMPPHTGFFSKRIEETRKLIDGDK